MNNNANLLLLQIRIKALKDKCHLWEGAKKEVLTEYVDYLYGYACEVIGGLNELS